MSERARNGAFLAAIIGLAVVLALTVSVQPQSESRVSHIGSRIKCPVCQGESIADSPSQMAQDMMALIAERVAEGVSDEAIEAELLAAYSGAVLLDPPMSGRTLALWLAPLAVALIGLAVIVRWRRQAPVAAGDGAVDPGSGRKLAGGILLTGAMVAIVVIAATTLQDREGPAAGVANPDTQDLENVSNETMAAVIAANADHPEINGMRLALAERYYEAGDYRSAFPYYLAVVDSGQATQPEAVTSLVRLGWMAYEGNAETETALTLFDRALEIDPTSQVALYLKGTVLWCGDRDAESARALFVALLDDPELPEQSRVQIEDDLARLDSGEECA